MALANARLPEQQDITFALDESTGRQVEHLLFWNFRIEMKVEVLERLLVLEVRASHSLVELLGVSSFDLVLEQAVQEFFVRQTVVHRLAEAQLERVQDPAELQLLEQWDELVNGAHGLPPLPSASRSPGVQIGEVRRPTPQSLVSRAAEAESPDPAPEST